MVVVMDILIFARKRRVADAVNDLGVDRELSAPEEASGPGRGPAGLERYFQPLEESLERALLSKRQLHRENVQLK